MAPKKPVKKKIKTKTQNTKKTSTHCVNKGFDKNFRFINQIFPHNCAVLWQRAAVMPGVKKVFYSFDVIGE